MSDSYVGIFPGDGHKMGLWVGAAWQNAPEAAPMINCGAIGPKYHYAANFWGINLNKDGKRFMAETTNFAHAAYPILMQPDQKAYFIWDKAYAYRNDGWLHWGCSYQNTNGTMPYTPEEEIQRWEDEVEKGNWAKADTIEELVKQLEGLNAENALETIATYNKYAEQGFDEEYLVNPDYLFPIAEGPFYGARSQITNDFNAGSVPCFLTVCGGLRTNEHMQVCDEDDNPIEGLYNVGIMTGDFYANHYSFTIFGQNHGACCLTFPRLLAQDFANMA